MSQIKALKESDGDDVRALDGDDQVVDASKVQAYLSRAFGTRLADAEQALKVRSFFSYMQDSFVELPVKVKHVIP